LKTYDKPNCVGLKEGLSTICVCSAFKSDVGSCFQRMRGTFPSGGWGCNRGWGWSSWSHALQEMGDRRVRLQWGWTNISSRVLPVLRHIVYIICVCGSRNGFHS